MFLGIVAGQMIGKKVSERVITMMGGLLFLVFSGWELIAELI